MSKNEKAFQIQKHIDWEYNIDISMFQNSELRRLATEIQKFLDLGVETEDLDPAEDFLQDEIDALEAEDPADSDFDDVTVTDVEDEDEIL